MKLRKSCRWERNLSIAMAVIDQGRTLAEVAREYRLSIERIRALVFYVARKVDEDGVEAAIAGSPRSHRIPILRDHRNHFVPALQRQALQ